MDLSLNFATDDAAPRGGRKAKPAAGGGAKRRQQRPKPQKHAGGPSSGPSAVSISSQRDGGANQAATASARTAGNATATSLNGGGRTAAAGHGRRQQADTSMSLAGEHETASKTQQSGRPQVISSLFPKLPHGSRTRPDAIATENQEETEDAPATVLDASNAPSMADDFSSLPLRKSIVAHLKGKMGLAHPTTIQKLAVPFLCNSETRKKDAILQAQTGSGKTLSYLLPIIEDLLRISTSVSRSGKPIDRSIGTLAIILVPTRELANQIFEVACRLLSFPSDGEMANHRWITPGLLTGGAHRQHEKARLRKGIPLLIATPGRLLDHLETTKAFRLAGEVVRKPKDLSSRTLDEDEIGSDDEFAIEDSLHTSIPAAAGGEDEISSDEDFEGKGVSRSHRRNAPLTSSQETTLNPHLNLRWLVLDEADRLMDMGFEPQITSIMDLLSSRLDKRKATLARALNNGDVRSRLGGQKRKYIELDQRRTLLCSATIQENVEKLAGVALKEPLLIKGDGDTSEGARSTSTSKTADGSSWSHYAPPSQLSQMYAVVEAKLRFVALIALLRQLLLPTHAASGPPQKILVFLSCTDSVDLHWHAMANLRMGRGEEGDITTTEKRKNKSSETDNIRTQSIILPGTSVYRLHGSLDLKTRLASLKGFSGNKKGPSVLFCTSVAARGLDVPDVNCVIQYDLPTEGGVTEYVHRVGRTARAGASGQSWVFLLPSEAGWVDWAEKEMKQKDDGSVEKRLQEKTIHFLLKSGYGGKDARDYETRATDVQMAYERWVAEDASNLNLARKAFSSHVRAYATHPSNEKDIFHVKNLHLGHLAKAFGLREAPAGIGGVPKQKKQAAGARLAPENKRKRPSAASDSDSSEDETTVSKRPTIPRSGRALEGKGLHGPHGVTRRDFNIANTSALEALVARKGIRR